MKKVLVSGDLLTQCLTEGYNTGGILNVDKGLEKGSKLLGAKLEYQLMVDSEPILALYFLEPGEDHPESEPEQQVIQVTRIHQATTYTCEKCGNIGSC